MIVRSRLFIALAVTIALAFMLGFAASQGVFGAQGWAVALIVGAATAAIVAVALAPLSRRRDGRHAHGLHLLRR